MGLFQDFLICTCKWYKTPRLGLHEHYKRNKKEGLCSWWTVPSTPSFCPCLSDQVVFHLWLPNTSSLSFLPCNLDSSLWFNLGHWVNKGGLNKCRMYKLLSLVSALSGLGLESLEASQDQNRSLVIQLIHQHRLCKQSTCSHTHTFREHSKKIEIFKKIQ